MLKVFNIKRSFDILFSLILMLLLLPLYLIVSIVIIVGTGFPVFFIQSRVGLSGRMFIIYKFRTMIKNASEIGPYFTASEDPRITRIGRFLRKTSLDELPQFFNVLLGDMSVVGPRPNVEKQKEEYQAEDWALRNSVRPGITGLAQVSGRSQCSFEERLNYDLEYVKTHNMLMDSKIIYQTLMGVIKRKGSF